MPLSPSSSKYLSDRGILPEYQEFFVERSQGQASQEMGKVLHCGGFSPSIEYTIPGCSIQFHPETPYVGKDGKPQKWITSVGDRSGFCSFTPISKDFVIVTEGIVKAMAAYQYGYNSLSINGVDNWSVPESRDPKGNREVKPLLLRNLPPVIYLAFDMDWQSNPNVLRAMADFNNSCTAQGREVFVLEWDPGKKGLDDYLADLDRESSIVALDGMISRAFTFDEFIQRLDDEAHVGKIELPKDTPLEHLFQNLMIEKLRGKVIIPQDQNMVRQQMGWAWNPGRFTFEIVHLSSFLVGEADAFLTALYQKGKKKVGGEWVNFEKGGFNTSKNLRDCMHRITPIVKILATSTDSVPDADPNLIRFNNGVYDLRKNELYQDDKYLSVSAGYSLSSDPTPNFDAWVKSSFKGKDKSLILAAIRFLVDPSPRYEKLIHIHGASGSGKGLFCRLLWRLLGNHHVSQSPLDGLLQPDKIRQALRSSRLCIDSDHHGLLNDPTLIYKIVSQEPIDVRDLYDPISKVDNKPRRILIASIEPLNIKASSGAEGGWVRRCLPIKTRCSERIEGIEDLVYEELGGIMSQVLSLTFDQAISILGEYERGSVSATDKAAESPLVTFMEAHTVQSEGCKSVSPGQLYKVYKDWSLFRGIKPLSLSTFHRRLEDKGLRPPVVGKSYLGIDWVDYELQRAASPNFPDQYDPINYSNS